MNSIQKKRSCWALTALTLVWLGACTVQKTGKNDFSGEVRFTLDYGSFEKELNLFDLTYVGMVNTHLTMRDGFFYISNGAAQKIMHLNSYGDLLALYYNADTNPAPLFESGTGNTEIATQTTSRYPFHNPGSIALDSHKNLYVVETLPPDLMERDEAKHLLLSQIVLRFASDGTFIGTIGQEGPDGTPFPFVKGMYVTKNDEMVVVCQVSTNMVVYWYSAAGALMYMIPINQADLPNPVQKETENETYLSLTRIVPDYTERQLYINIDYYMGAVDSASKVQYGITYDRTLLFTFDVASAAFSRPILIPPYERTVEENLATIVYPLAYEFLGQSETGWFFYLLADANGYLLQMVQQNGQRIIKRRLDMDTSKLRFFTFALSPEGIVSALLAGEKNASVVWWRTDTLLQN